jgi:hypothetical protein
MRWRSGHQALASDMILGGMILGSLRGPQIGLGNKGRFAPSK